LSPLLSPMPPPLGHEPSPIAQESFLVAQPVPEVLQHLRPSTTSTHPMTTRA